MQNLTAPGSRIIMVSGDTVRQGFIKLGFKVITEFYGKSEYEVVLPGSENRFRRAGELSRAELLGIVVFGNSQLKA